MPGEPSAHEGALNLSPGRPQTLFSSGVRCFCCQQSAHIGDLPLAPLAWRRKRGHDTPNTSAGGDGGSNISPAGVTRILALIHGSSDGTLRRAQDLRRALHAPHSRGLRLGIQASLALLRRMEASRVGCDGQLAAKCVRLAHAASTRADASRAAMPASRIRTVRTKQEAHAD